MNRGSGWSAAPRKAGRWWSWTGNKLEESMEQAGRLHSPSAGTRQTNGNKNCQGGYAQLSCMKLFPLLLLVTRGYLYSHSAKIVNRLSIVGVTARFGTLQPGSSDTRRTTPAFVFSNGRLGLTVAQALYM